MRGRGAKFSGTGGGMGWVLAYLAAVACLVILFATKKLKFHIPRDDD